MWFPDVEDVIYSFVEYIQLVGAVYSFKHAGIAHSEQEWKRLWHSIANSSESAICDTVLLTKYGEPVSAVLIHKMADGLTNKLIDIHTSQITPRIQLNKAIDQTRGHIIVGGSTQEQSEKVAKELFEGKAKGIHQFHQSLFSGTLQHSVYASQGETMWLRLPDGLFDGAPCYFMWRWTIDAAGAHNSPSWTFGQIKLESGAPTRFVLGSKKGWYAFWGEILTKDVIVARMREGDELSISMARREVFL